MMFGVCSASRKPRRRRFWRPGVPTAPGPADKLHHFGRRRGAAEPSLGILRLRGAPDGSQDLSHREGGGSERAPKAAEASGAGRKAGGRVICCLYNNNSTLAWPALEVRPLPIEPAGGRTATPPGLSSAALRLCVSA